MYLVYFMGSATGRAGGALPPLILKNNFIMRLAPPLNFWRNIYSSGSRGNRVNVAPQDTSFRAERMRIDCRKNFNFSLIFPNLY